MTGTSSRTARVPTRRWDLKEAGGKLLTRGTRTVSEAVHHGQGSVGVRSPKSSRMMSCIYGGNGRKVTRLTLGDLCSCLVLGRSRDSLMAVQKSAEGIVGQSQVRLVRHSRCESRSQQLGQTAKVETEGLNK